MTEGNDQGSPVEGGGASDGVEGTKFTGVVDFENVFEGYLPAAEYPKIPVCYSLLSLSLSENGNIK
jgi:hypothetical protein